MRSNHSALLNSNLRYWQNQGLAMAELLRAAGITPSQRRPQPVRVDARQHCLLFEASHRQLQDPAMGIRLGQQLMLPDLSPLGDALHYFQDGWQAMELLVNFWPLLSEAQQITLHTLGERAAIRCTPVAGLAVHRMQIHAVLSGFIRMAGVLLGIGVTGGDITLELQDDQADTDLFATLLGMPVRAGCPHSQVTFPTALLDTRNPFSDEAHYQQALRHCQKAMRELDDNHFMETIHDHLSEQLESGQADQKKLADSLQMSVRNLQRRLSTHQTRFRDLVDQVRERQARQLVLGSTASFSDIAVKLGYEDTSSFYKAFKRWFGLPPGEFREQQQDNTRH